MIYGIIIIGSLIIIAVSASNKSKHAYNASFGTASEYLSRFNHGIAVTGNKAITKKLSHTNVALFGPTGSGKSTIVIISSAISLARGKSSMIFPEKFTIEQVPIWQNKVISYYGLIFQIRAIPNPSIPY